MGQACVFIICTIRVLKYSVTDILNWGRFTPLATAGKCLGNCCLSAGWRCGIYQARGQVLWQPSNGGQARGALANWEALCHHCSPSHSFRFNMYNSRPQFHCSSCFIALLHVGTGKEARPQFAFGLQHTCRDSDNVRAGSIFTLCSVSWDFRVEIKYLVHILMQKAFGLFWCQFNMSTALNM